MEREQVRWLTESEVARLVGFSLPTLRNHRCLGVGLPYYKIGRAVRYRWDQIMEWMERHKVQLAE